MKFSNKFINGLLLAGLFPFLFGCDRNEAVFVYSKGISICYVDKEGNILYFDKEGNIKYFDKTIFFSWEFNEEDFLKTCPMESLSFTNERGIPIRHNFAYRLGHGFVFYIMENEEQKREYSYIIKYKIPPLTGESVEEIRLTLKETEYGIPDGWHNCQYNGRNIRIITIEDIFPDWHDPQKVVKDQETVSRRLIEVLYNGDLVAYESDGNLSLIIPIDIVPEHN